MEKLFTRTTVLMILVGGGNLLAGLVFLGVVAATYGAGRSLEAFYLADAVPGFLNDRLLFGAVNIVLVPLLCSERLRANRQESWHIASTFISLLTVLSAVYVAVILLAAPVIVRAIAPGFDPEQAALTVKLLRLLSFTTLIFTVVSWMRGILHAHNVFVAPYLAGVVYFGLSALFVLVGSPWLGIWALGAGTLLAAVIFGAIHLVPLRRIRVDYRFGIDRSVVRGPLMLFFSYMLVSMATHINYLVDRYFASQLAPGSIVILSLAQKFEIPVTFIVTFAIAIPALTIFSNAVGNEEQLRDGVRNSLGAMSALAIPLISLLLVVRLPLARVWFEHGEFTLQDSLRVASVVLCFGPSFLVNAYGAILINGYFSLRAVRICLAVMAGEVALNIWLTALLVRPLGLEGIALATSLATLLTNLLLWAVLRSKLKGLGFQGKRAELGRLLSYCLVTASSFFGLRCLAGALLPGLLDGRPLPEVLFLAVSAFLLFLVLGVLFRIPEVRELVRLFQGLLRGEPASNR